MKKNKELKNECRFIGQLDFVFAAYNLSHDDMKIWNGMNPVKHKSCAKRAYQKFCKKHPGEVYFFQGHPIWDRITEC